MKKQLNIRPATVEDCLFVGPRLRDADRAEAAAAGFADPTAALTGSLAAADETFTGCHFAEPMAIFGITRPALAADEGRIWMLGTPRLSLYGRELFRVTRRYAEDKAGEYGRLCNYVDARYVAAIRYLAACGFAFVPERDLLTAAGLRFCYFEFTGRR